MGPHSAIRWWVPPMLDVALPELMCGRTQQMLTDQGWLGVNQGHRVLQLVAKSVCTTGLIKPGTSPKTTTQDLVQQPAIGHQVYRGVRSFHVDSTKRLLPVLTSTFEGRLGGTGCPIAFDQVLGMHQVAPGSQAKLDLSFLCVRQIECDLHRRTRVQPDPGFA